MTRILIVEDSPTQAEQLRWILTSADYQADKAPDGETALVALQDRDFALVISDILMPGMSGYELCRAIKSDEANADVPVILLTSLSDPLDIIRGLESGADNFVTKPYSPDHLLGRIEGVLESARLRRDGGPRNGVEILFLGERFVIDSDKQRVLDLLVSTFEDAVRKNQELQASQSALKAANRELEAFSYSVSHDLRAPLRRIEGFGRALHRRCSEQVDEAALDYVDRIQRSIVHMNGLVEAMLGLARVTRQDLRKGTVDLSALAREVAGEIRAAEPERVGNFVVQDDLTVIGDASLLRIVLENLLGNAWKFTRDVTARIELGRSSSQGAPVFFVRDNGAGFDTAYASELFAPFQRLHAEAEYPGTGVGLATVQRILHRHGGRIWAEAAVGKGATFFFSLPAG